MTKNILVGLPVVGVSMSAGTVKAQEKPTNQSIVDMVKLGLGKSVIETKINSSFNFSVQ